MIFQTRSNTSSIELSFMRNPFFLILYHTIFFPSLNYKFNSSFSCCFLAFLSALRAVSYSAFYFCTIYSLYAKRNVLSKSFPFVCRYLFFKFLNHARMRFSFSYHKRVFAECTVMPASPFSHPTVRRKKPPAATDAQVSYLLNTPSTATFHPAYFFSRISSSIFGSYTRRFIFPASFSRS